MSITLRHLHELKGHYTIQELTDFASHRINKTPTCWLWTGASYQGSGYGRIKFNKNSLQGPLTFTAHRFCYELFIGPIPIDKVLDHLCRNPICVNPEHLDPVTSHENVVVRGRTITKINAEKTHCDEGHLLEGDNLMLRTPAYRIKRGCRICHNTTGRKNRDKDSFRKYHAAYERERKKQLKAIKNNVDLKNRFSEEEYEKDPKKVEAFAEMTGAAIVMKKQGPPTILIRILPQGDS